MTGFPHKFDRQPGSWPVCTVCGDGVYSPLHKRPEGFTTRCFECGDAKCDGTCGNLGGEAR